MTSIQEFVNGMIGEAPLYFDYLAYVISAVVMLSLMEFLFDMFRGMARMFR